MERQESNVVSPNLLDSVRNSEKQEFSPREYQKVLFKRHFFATSKQKEKNYYKGVYYDEASGFVVATNGIQIILRAYESTLPTFQKFNNKLINPDCKSGKYDTEIGGCHLRTKYPDYQNEDIIYKEFACNFTFPHSSIKEAVSFIKKAVSASSREYSSTVFFTVNGETCVFDADSLINGLEILDSETNSKDDVMVLFPTRESTPNITIQCGNMLYILMGIAFNDEDLEDYTDLGEVEM